jgi:hypothetical protein
LKRWRAGARGRAKPYLKYTSHIRVVLEAKQAKPAVASKVKSAKVNEKSDDNKKSETSNPKSETNLKIQKKNKTKIV